MALVEPQLLESLQMHQHHQNHQPQAMLDNELCELDKAMQEVFDKRNASQEEKLKLYHHILQKYLLYSKKVQPLEVKVVEDKTSSSSPITENFGKLEEEVAEVSPIEMEIIQSAPKNLKQKASLLM